MLNYPNQIKKEFTKIKNFGNRGMTLESDLNESNQYYLDNDIAVIYKKPTPIQVVKQKNERIVDAYFKSPSTTDYNGLYDGKYIDFEAKETKNNTSFPLHNIHPHQIKHIRNIVKHKGICFLIVRFTNLNITYLLFGKDFLSYIDNADRQSVPISFFNTNGYIIKEKIAPRLDYLEVIKKWEEKHEKI